MHLGALLNHLSSEDDAAAALEALGNVVLFTDVREASDRFAETPGEYVANAVRRFAGIASDEDWLGLMTAMERAHDPARAALDRVIRWALKMDAAGAEPSTSCSCGSGRCHDQLG